MSEAAVTEERPGQAAHDLGLARALAETRDLALQGCYDGVAEANHAEWLALVRRGRDTYGAEWLEQALARP